MILKWLMDLDLDRKGKKLAFDKKKSMETLNALWKEPEDNVIDLEDIEDSGEIDFDLDFSLDEDGKPTFSGSFIPEHLGGDRKTNEADWPLAEALHKAGVIDAKVVEDDPFSLAKSQGVDISGLGIDFSKFGKWEIGAATEIDYSDLEDDDVTEIDKDGEEVPLGHSKENAGVSTEPIFDPKKVTKFSKGETGELKINDWEDKKK